MSKKVNPAVTTTTTTTTTTTNEAPVLGVKTVGFVVLQGRNDSALKASNKRPYKTLEGAKALSEKIEAEKNAAYETKCRKEAEIILKRCEAYAKELAAKAAYEQREFFRQQKAAETTSKLLEWSKGHNKQQQQKAKHLAGNWK